MLKRVIAGAVGIWCISSTFVMAQDTLRVMFYAPDHDLARALQNDIVDAPEWEKAGLSLELVETSVPYSVALKEGLADLVFVPINHVQNQAIKPIGFSDILSQPFARLKNSNIEFLLEGAYRDFLLADLEQEEAIALSVASLGSSSLFSRVAIRGLEDTLGSKWALATPIDRGFEQLGVSPQYSGPENMQAAVVAGSVDAVEIFDSALVTELTGEFPEAGVFTDLQPFLLASLMQSEVWRAKSEDQRLAIGTILERAESDSFTRVTDMNAKLAEVWMAAGASQVSPFETILPEDFVQGQKAAWIEGNQERIFTLSIFEASIEAQFNSEDLAPRSPSPDDRGDLKSRRIWFATDRKLFSNQYDFDRTFGVAPIDPSNGRYRCGAVTWPNDPSRRLGDPIVEGLVFDGAIVDEKGCNDLLKRIAESSDGRLMLFIHGYNTRFPAAVARAAALQEDLRLDAELVLWSWPSAGAPGAYFEDGRAIASSRWRLLAFLDALVASGIKRIDLIAHSMGGRLGIETLVYAGGKSSSQFMHAVFVAPDVPTDDYSNAISGSRYSGHVTLYANEHDRALMASRAKNQTTPAGLAGLSVLMMDGLETVDASEVDDDLFPDLNHAHAFDVPEALADLIGRLTDEVPPPGSRQLRREPASGTPNRWIIEEDVNLR